MKLLFLLGSQLDEIRASSRHTIFCRPTGLDRFYSLYDKVCWVETLERAYRQAKANAGAAGVDGVRFEDIEAYGVERWLAEFRQELVEETYRPHPVRRVMIPKPGGGERPLGIPSMSGGGRRSHGRD